MGNETLYRLHKPTQLHYQTYLNSIITGVGERRSVVDHVAGDVGIELANLLNNWHALRGGGG